MKNATRYELIAMKTGDFMGKTEVFAEVSLDELRAVERIVKALATDNIALSLNRLKTVERIARALAGDKSGVLLETVKKHVDFWERSATALKPAKPRGRQ